VGDTMSESHQNFSFDVCYGNYEGGDEASFADFNGELNGGNYKVTWVELSASWCEPCWDAIPIIDNITAQWEDDENVAMVTVLDDIGQPYSCTQWGNAGTVGIPIILDDGSGYTIFNWFESQSAFPSNAFIDHTMTVHYKTNNIGTYIANLKIQEMIDDCDEAGLCNNVDMDSDGIENDVDNCPNDANTDQADLDEDGLGDVCDDCHNLNGDLNDDTILNILDIVSVVNMILSGGANSPDFNDCQKEDADMDNNSIVNILDVIQIINQIVGMSRVAELTDLNADVIFHQAGDDLVVSIESNSNIAGIEFALLGDYANTFDLKDNSHITVESSSINGITHMLAYSLFNQAFDSHTVEFTIKGAGYLNSEDIMVTVGSQNGDAFTLTLADEDGIYQNGPDTFTLSSVYPNPFNPSTEIEFTLPSDGYVRLSAYNVMGQEMSVIYDGFQSIGTHSYTWNASELPSGVYYIRLLSGNRVETTKAILMK
jgi:thiol-disulfide isomerase/thioredoxin